MQSKTHNKVSNKYPRESKGYGLKKIENEANKKNIAREILI